jgi:hypothetical protein
VDGEEALGKIRGLELSSWNFFLAFGHDGLGQIGSETTINSGDLAGFL